MKVQKLKSVLLTILLATVFTVSRTSAEDSNLQSAADEGKQILSDLGRALKSISSSVEEEVNKGISKTKNKLAEKIIGTWKFSNGTSSTIIVCNDDETMTITQKGLLRKRTWTGTFIVIGGTISFNITGENNSGETWKLKYRLTDTATMQLSSDSLPDDYNKYDFSTAATFTK